MTAVEDGTAAQSELDLVREGVYRFLASLLRDPRHAATGWQIADEFRQWLLDGIELIRSESSVDDMDLGEGERSIESLRIDELLDRIEEQRDNIPVEHQRVFGLIACQDCPPYETEFVPDSEPFFRTQQMADIAGFYRAFGLQCSASRVERPDHISLELEFMALLLTKKRLASLTDAATSEVDERREICESTMRDFFNDHLGWWLPPFGQLLIAKDPLGLYGALGEFLAAWSAQERVRFGLPPVRRRVEPIRPESPDDDCDRCLATSDLVQLQIPQ